MQSAEIIVVNPDFTGMPVSSMTSVQSSGPTTTTVQTTITYDQAYRVTAVDQNYDGGTTVHVATYSYNELGELTLKNLGYVNPTTWLQKVNMRYSIRGQLLYINNSKLNADGGATSNESNGLFGMQLLYDGADANLYNGAGNVNKYDGRLTAVKWMTRDAGGNKSYERSYIYSYDAVARYNGENYSERTVLSTGSFSNNLNGFDESGIAYDENGNILSLQRNSSTQGTNSHIQIDNLTYGYNSSNYNRVSTITDGMGANYTGAGFRNLTGSSTAYTYDADGNLVNDYYKGLQNNYDAINRVDKTTITAGTNQYINYIYDAGGNLIRKLANNNGTQTQTDYIGGFVYINGVLSYFPMPEGRVINNGSTLTQEYIITDQQGNARISFQNNGSGSAVVTQENSYYGFGLQLLNSPVGLPAIPNKQLYNGGSEWQNDYANGSTNLPDYYQTFFRNYDAATGRFIGQDPDAEGAESLSVYQYAGNMPVMLNDPMGDLLPMPGSHTAPSSNWQVASWFGAQMPEDLQAQQDDFNGGGSGVFGSDASLAWYLGTTGQAGGVSTKDPLVISYLIARAYAETYGTLPPANSSDNSGASNPSFDWNPYDPSGQSQIINGTSANGTLATVNVNPNVGTGVVVNNNNLQALVGQPYPRGAIGGPVPWYGNFLGPGPNGNPYKLRGYNGKTLMPIDMLDAAAQRHDYQYYLADTGGVVGALFDTLVFNADLDLANAALEVQVRFSKGLNDTITGKPITEQEATWAEAVFLSFKLIGNYKYGLIH